MIEVNEVDQTVDFHVKIKVVGVGGGGSNMISHIINNGTYETIELAVANTDAQALGKSKAPIKIQLGEKLTQGLGAGMKPEVGENAALETYDKLKEFLSGAELVFVSAGLGGGTGTGAAPIIAKAAKEVGALTVAVVTKPFKNEGKKRSLLAEQGYQKLREECDSIVVIPNEKLLSIIDKNLGIKDSYRIVDDVLARAVNGMSGVILSYGEDDVNVDFADVRTVMEHNGLALMGIGEASGADAAKEAVKMAIESPLFDNMSIAGAKGILVHFYINPDYPLHEVNDAMAIINDNGADDADIIYGTTTDTSVNKDQVRITIVATGFEKEIAQSHKESENSVLKLVSPKDLSQKITQQDVGISARKKVSGDAYNAEEYLDVPAYLRRQMD